MKTIPLNQVPNPDFPQTKEGWYKRMVEQEGEEWLKSEDRERFDRDWPRFKTLI